MSYCVVYVCELYDLGQSDTEMKVVCESLFGVGVKLVAQSHEVRYVFRTNENCVQPEGAFDAQTSFQMRQNMPTAIDKSIHCSKNVR